MALNIQIIGTKKCAETRKAERFFKERGLKVQFRDLKQQALSGGEIKKIAQAVGGVDNIIDRGSKEFEKRNLKWISLPAEEALQKYPLITATPIVRNGPKATVGHAPETWEAWIDADS